MTRKFERIDLKYVKKTPDGKRIFQCPHCEKSYTHSEQFRDHMRTHTGDRPFQCAHCKKSFKSMKILGSHIRIHTGEKPFLCSICGQSFTQKSNLYGHMKRHAGGLQLDCTMCDKKFKSKGSLKFHMMVHYGQKPYKCPICNHSFRQTSTLRQHMTTHTTQRPFPCTECGHQCLTRTQLKIHMRNHTGEMPFQCLQCEYKGKRRSDLKYHMMAHSGERPFLCSHCGTTFKRRGHLRRHMKMHGLALEDDEEPACDMEITSQGNNTQPEMIDSQSSQEADLNWAALSQSHTVTHPYVEAPTGEENQSENVPNFQDPGRPSTSELFDNINPGRPHTGELRDLMSDGTKKDMTKVGNNENDDNNEVEPLSDEEDFYDDDEGDTEANRDHPDPVNEDSAAGDQPRHTQNGTDQADVSLANEKLDAALINQKKPEQEVKNLKDYDDDDDDDDDYPLAELLSVGETYDGNEACMELTGGHLDTIEVGGVAGDQPNRVIGTCVKRKRGRPRKNKGDNTDKPKRGRPRKYYVADQTADETPADENADAVTLMNQNKREEEVKYLKVGGDYFIEMEPLSDREKYDDDETASEPNGDQSDPDYVDNDINDTTGDQPNPIENCVIRRSSRPKKQTEEKCYTAVTDLKDLKDEDDYTLAELLSLGKRNRGRPKMNPVPKMYYTLKKLEHMKQRAKDLKTALRQANIEKEQAAKKLRQMRSLMYKHGYKKENQRWEGIRKELKKKNRALKKKSNQLEQTENKVHETNNQLYQTNSELYHANNDLMETNNELLETNNKLEEANKELKETNNELYQKNNELYQKNYELYQKNNELKEAMKETNSKLSEMVTQSETLRHDSYIK